MFSLYIEEFLVMLTLAYNPKDIWHYSNDVYILSFVYINIERLKLVGKQIL